MENETEFLGHAYESTKRILYTLQDNPNILCLTLNNIDEFCSEYKDKLIETLTYFFFDDVVANESYNYNQMRFLGALIKVLLNFTSNKCLWKGGNLQRKFWAKYFCP